VVLDIVVEVQAEEYGKNEICRALKISALQAKMSNDKPLSLAAGQTEVRFYCCL